MGKVTEIRDYLDNSPYQIVPQSDFKISSVKETGLSFIENAILKARHACSHTQLPAFGEDSGLLVDALDGQPGLFSSRFSGPTATDEDNINKLLNQLENTGKNNRGAYFYCALAFLLSPTDPKPAIFTASWHGEITNQPIGKKGFGYDPIFLVHSHQKTAAELDIAVKNQISHRAQVLAQFKHFLNQTPC